jgi:two-component system, sensor histidine kinase LadS
MVYEVDEGSAREVCSLNYYKMNMVILGTRAFAGVLVRRWSRIVGWLVSCALLSVWLGYAALAHAQAVPNTKPVQIAAPAKSLTLPQQVDAFNVPLSTPLDPQVLWDQPYLPTQAANVAGLWHVVDGQRTAAKFTLSAQTEQVYAIEVPLSRMDLVDVFWRSPGQAWSHAQAGDTVALSRWPIVGQYPTFMVHFASLPSSLDVLVVMQNAGFAETTMVLSADRASSERRLIQANASGLMIGACATVMVICLLLCILYRNQAGFYLLAYSIAVTMGSILLNGYGAIWFTPEWPQFNDSIKPFTATLICTAMLFAVKATLDKSVVSRGWHMAVTAMGGVLLVYAFAQLTLLPFTWRLIGGAGGGVLVAFMGLGLCWSCWRKGDRYALWVALAVVLFAMSVVVVTRGFIMVWGIGLFSALTSLCLIASVLVLRHVLALRERYGRAVLGRAVINEHRDPLTALLSYEGFERAVDTLAVRQQSGGGVAHVLYFSLLHLDNFRHEDGYIIWQRDLVRFAAVLQKALGNDWQIARLSNSKFGAVRLADQRSLAIEPLLTLVLTSCSRKIDTQGWVDRVGLRLASVCTPLTSSGLQDSLRLLDQSVRDLGPGKRIALL